jgi:ribosome-binding factor A
LVAAYAGNRGQVGIKRLNRYLRSMDSTRQLKYSKLIQKEIGTIFQRDGLSFYGRAFVTVTGVRVSPDLGIAKVYLSIFGVKNPKETIAQIESHTKEIRKKLGNEIRHQARIIPELKFFLDDSLDYVEKIEKLLNETKTPLNGAEGPPAE